MPAAGRLLASCWPQGWVAWSSGACQQNSRSSRVEASQVLQSRQFPFSDAAAAFLSIVSLAPGPRAPRMAILIILLQLEEFCPSVKRFFGKPAQKLFRILAERSECDLSKHTTLYEYWVLPPPKQGEETTKTNWCLWWLMMMLLTMLLVLSGPLSRESCKPLIGFNEPPSPCAACSFGICKYAFKGVIPITWYTNTICALLGWRQTT